MRTLLALLLAATLAVGTTTTITHAAPVPGTRVFTMLHPVGNSGIAGFVTLTQQAPSGTSIVLLAFGLQPGHPYVSLYYGNHVCALEPYSASDVIGGIYFPNRVGVGVTHGIADDDLDEINSVSVRNALTFNLLACANVHPGG